MCVVNGVRLSRAEFLEYLAIKKELQSLQMELHRPAQYGFTYQDWPVIKPIEGKKDFEIVSMDWEFRPVWVKNMDEMKLIRKGIDPKTMKQGKPIPWLNAKAENLLVSSMWKPSALKRRCIVPTDYFFEWRHVYPIGKKGEPLKTAIKIPYMVKAKGEGKVYMAGIYTPWKNGTTNETIDTFAIVTTEANEVMRMIHNSKNRMPTFLSEEMAEAWLWGNLTEADISVIGGYQWPSDQMEFHTVSKDFLKEDEPLTEVAWTELKEPEKPKDLFS